MDVTLAIALVGAAVMLAVLVYLMYDAARRGEWLEFSQKTRAEMYEREKKS
jgi:hypothetical protein